MIVGLTRLHTIGQHPCCFPETGEKLLNVMKLGELYPFPKQWQGLPISSSGLGKKPRIGIRRRRDGYSQQGKEQFMHAKALEDIWGIESRERSSIQESVSDQPLYASTVSSEPLPTVPATASGPFCCFNFSSNLANSFIAISSSWSRTC